MQTKKNEEEEEEKEKKRRRERKKRRRRGSSSGRVDIVKILHYSLEQTKSQAGCHIVTLPEKRTKQSFEADTGLIGI